GGPVHGVGVHPGDLLTELASDVGDVHELTAVLVGEEVLQVLHHVQVGGAAGGQVGDHLRVVVVRAVLDQVDGDVRVLLVEGVGEHLELRGGVQAPPGEADGHLTGGAVLPSFALVVTTAAGGEHECCRGGRGGRGQIPALHCVVLSSGAPGLGAGAICRVCRVIRCRGVLRAGHPSPPGLVGRPVSGTVDVAPSGQAISARSGSMRTWGWSTAELTWPCRVSVSARAAQVHPLRAGQVATATAACAPSGDAWSRCSTRRRASVGANSTAVPRVLVSVRAGGAVCTPTPASSAI